MKYFVIHSSRRRRAEILVGPRCTWNQGLEKSSITTARLVVSCLQYQKYSSPLQRVLDGSGLWFHYTCTFHLHGMHCASYSPLRQIRQGSALWFLENGKRMKNNVMKRSNNGHTAYSYQQFRYSLLYRSTIWSSFCQSIHSSWGYFVGKRQG